MKFRLFSFLLLSSVLFAEENYRNFKANLRILEKLTGITRDIKLTNLKNEETIGDFKVRLLSTSIQKITPSLITHNAFLEIWKKEANNDWKLVYSNWLSNYELKFLDTDWGLYILSVG